MSDEKLEQRRLDLEATRKVGHKTIRLSQILLELECIDYEQRARIQEEENAAWEIKNLDELYEREEHGDRTTDSEA